MAELFNAGDEVRSKTSEQKMIVISSDDAGVVCSWTDSRNKLHKETFPAALLEKWEPRGPSVFII